MRRVLLDRHIFETFRLSVMSIHFEAGNGSLDTEKLGCNGLASIAVGAAGLAKNNVALGSELFSPACAQDMVFVMPFSLGGSF